MQNDDWVERDFIATNKKLMDELKFLKLYVDDLQNQIDCLQDQLNEFKWSVNDTGGAS